MHRDAEGGGDPLLNDLKLPDPALLIGPEGLASTFAAARAWLSWPQALGWGAAVHAYLASFPPPSLAGH
jgi:hypothetical protein